MKFETPVVEVMKFDLVDVLTTSGAGAPEETEEEMPVFEPPCI